MDMPRIAYVNGEFLPLADARISILDRGFLFADGVYEVSAVLGGRLVDNAAHLARLERSLREIDIALPLSLPQIEEIQNEIVRRNAVAEGLIYLQVTRGAAERDFAFPGSATPSLVMFAQHKRILDQPAARSGVAVVTVEDIRWARRDIKSVALLAQVLAKQEAVRRGAFEAWMVTDGQVTEGSSSTAFIVSGRSIITRPLSNDILPGITRVAVMALAEKENLSVVERTFSVAEAMAADEAFLTSASSFVMPVISIDGMPVGGGTPGPITTKLRETYIELATA